MCIVKGRTHNIQYLDTDILGDIYINNFMYFILVVLYYKMAVKS